MNENRPKFKGDFSSNEVEMDLSKFIEMIDENYKLKEELSKREDERNPWQKAVHVAKTLDAWRPFPRLFIGMYIWLLYEVTNWAMNQPELSNAQAGIVSVIVGAGGYWFASYVNSKGDGKIEAPKK